MSKPSQNQSAEEKLKNLEKVHAELLGDLRHLKANLNIDANSVVIDEWDSGFTSCAKDTFRKLERILEIYQLLRSK